MASSISAKVAVQTDIFESIMSATLPVQALLAFMLFLSVYCWTVTFFKMRQLRKFQSMNEDFIDVFWRSSSLEHIEQSLSLFEAGNLPQIFRTGYFEVRRLAVVIGGSTTNVNNINYDSVERALRKAVDIELLRAEDKLGILATAGSTAPFLGLLGTVIGIMTSFSQIAASGSASLAVVAPGISEALFSTAVGLFVAIPAVVAYNFLLQRVRRLEIDMNNFCTDFLSVAKRNILNLGLQSNQVTAAASSGQGSTSSGPTNPGV